MSTLAWLWLFDPSYSAFNYTLSFFGIGPISWTGDPDWARFSVIFFFTSSSRHTILTCDWSSDVCSSDLGACLALVGVAAALSSQPRHVWYPLLVIGGATGLIGLVILPALRRRFAADEPDEARGATDHE